MENLGGMTFGPIGMEDQRVTMLSERVAAVQMRMTLQDWRFGEHVIPPNYELTDIWVWREGRWQVVNRISLPLDEMGGG